jgi:hypothetical protein
MSIRPVRSPSSRTSWAARRCLKVAEGWASCSTMARTFSLRRTAVVWPVSARVGTPGSARLRGEHDRVVDQPQVQHDTDQRPLRDAPQRGTLSSFEKSGEQLTLLRGEDSRITAVRAGLARLRVGEHPVLDPRGHHPGTGFHHAQSVCVGVQIRRGSLDPLGGPIPVHGAELRSRFEPRELHSADVSHKAWGQQKLRPAPYPCQEHAVRGGRLIP